MSPFVQLMAVFWCDSSICCSSTVVLLRLPADSAIFCFISAWKSGTIPLSIESIPFEPFFRPLFLGPSSGGCCAGTTGIGGLIRWLWLMELLLGLSESGDEIALEFSFFIFLLRLWLLFSSTSPPLAGASSFRLPNSVSGFDIVPLRWGIVIGEVIGNLMWWWFKGCGCFGRRFVKLVGPFTARWWFWSWLMGGDCDCCVMNWVSDEPWDIFWGELGCDDWLLAATARRSFHFRRMFLMRFARAWSLALFCLSAWRSFMIRVFWWRLKMDDVVRFRTEFHAKWTTHLNIPEGILCNIECFQTWHYLYDCCLIGYLGN